MARAFFRASASNLRHPMCFDSHASADDAGTASVTRAFPARFAIVPETAKFVETFCGAHGIGHDDTLRLVLVVEELVANTIMHGHRVECDAPITLTLRLVAEGIELRYEDTAPAFDITAALANAEATPDAALEARPVGELGLRLLAHYGRDARYRRESGRNRTWLTIRIGR
jgi:anti-sigma regulatory factor (Ser/Thr protein kinase)